MKKQSSILLILVLTFTCVWFPVDSIAVSPLGSASEINTTNIRPEAFATKVVNGTTEVSEKIYPLNPNGLVSVSNLNGSIKLSAWDRPEVKLITKKSAKTPEALEGVKVIVESDGAKFRVKVRYEFDGRGKKWKWNNGAYVNFELVVPATAVVDRLESTNGSIRVSGTRNLTVVSAVNGSIKAEDLAGQVSMETVNGSVRATMNGSAPIDDIKLGSVNGSATVYVPSSINATVKAETLNGSIRNDFGIPVKKGKYVGRDMLAKIGDGNAKILMTSVNGSINLLRLSDNGSAASVTNLISRSNSKSLGRSLVSSLNAEIESTRKKHLELMSKLVEQIARVEAETITDATKEAERKIEIATELAGQDIRVAEKELAEGIMLLRNTARSRTTSRYSVDTQEFNVGENPEIRVNAKGVDVSVRSWDEPRVSYRLSRVVNAGIEPVKYVNHNVNDDTVEIRVKSVPIFGQSKIDGVNLEVFVPKKSRLTVSTERSIRVEGIRGELNLSSRVGQIDVRDSNGKARLESTTGMIRVIGFEGVIETIGRTGDQYLEGDFSSITSSSRTGRVYLTIPESTDATITAQSTRSGQKSKRFLSANQKPRVESGDFQLVNRDQETWVLGKGTNNFKFRFRTGRLILRSSEAIGT